MAFNLLQTFKPMRIVLISLALLTLVLKAPLDMELSYQGWAMIRTLIVPVMPPLFFMVVLLDALIATIWFTQSQGQERTRYKTILIVNLSVATLLGAIWIPYFLEVLR